MDLRAWERPDPAAVVHLSKPADWSNLAAEYGAVPGSPFQRCLDVAQGHGACTAIVETRYIDPDYRSEYSAFHSKTFAATPDSARRIHLFREKIEADQLWCLPAEPGYLGYIVVRPFEPGPVVRSVLMPPDSMRRAVRTSIIDRVNLFGQELSVEGVPFTQQDTQLGRCAHAAAWMCHYMAYRKELVSRRYTGDFGSSIDPSLGWGRMIPSEGLTDRQLMELLRTFGLPCKYYSIDNLPSPRDLVPWLPPEPDPPSDEPTPHPGFWDTRIIPICCRYLNSGFPVLVATQDHTFVLCGYQREPREGAADWIRFIRQDDQQGPYLLVNNIFDDECGGFSYSPWQCLIVPLPDKLWLPPEPVEATAASYLRQIAAAAVSSEITAAEEVQGLIAKGRLALHTYAVTSNTFKRDLPERRMDAALVREYRLARLSRYVWVVELVDRERRTAGQECVLGEAVFDATSSETAPQELLLHVPGLAWIRTFENAAGRYVLCAPNPYGTGAVGPA